MEWMLLPLKRYAEFTGRSRRKEYWMFVLFSVLVMMFLGFLTFLGLGNLDDLDRADFSGTNPVFWLGIGLLFLFLIAIIVPSIAVTVRRLHDRNLSGWWYLGAILAGMIPVIGSLASIALIVVTLLPGTPGPNRFGEDPKDPVSADIFA